MKKKVIKALSLVLCISAFSAFALGSGSSDNTTIDKEITSTGNTNKETEKSTDTERSTETSTDTSQTNTSSSAVTIEEQVLLDQNDVVITATGMDEGLFGPELKLLIENNSDTNLTFQVRNSSVNGFMADTIMSQDVAAGKKANADITFTVKGLKACGVETFADMEFSFHIFSADNWDTYLESDMIKVETSAASTHTQQIDDSGTVLYDANGIKIVGKGLSNDDSIFGPGLLIYVENNTDKNYTIQVRDTSVNGFMIDTVMSLDITGGKKAIDAVTFMDSSLEENGITDINSIETSFHIFDADDWMTSFDSDPVTINF